MIATITSPKLLLIGGGAVKEVATVLSKLGRSRPFVVSDPFMVKSGMIERVTDPLRAAGIACEVFSDTVSDPTDTVVEQGVAAFKAGDFDCLIAFGGGSPIDTAKAIGLLASAGGRMRDYKVPHQPDHSQYPLIAIPTTAGTGSEVTKVTIITDVERDEKMLIMGLGCLPSAAIVDYELTLSVPKRTTADTGIDSLTHAIEAYVSKKANPQTDVLAKSAMALIARNIRAACSDAGDRAAREAMMLAATQAGMAFSNASVCLVHGMSRPIGAFFHVPHGLSNAMLLPAVTEYSAPAALGRYAECARVMGVADSDVGDQAAVAMLVEELRRLNSDLEVPSPKAYGIDERRYFDLAPTMAEQALASGSPGNNPKVPGKDEIVELYRRVWD